MLFGLAMLFLFIGLLMSTFDMFLPPYPAVFLVLVVGLRVLGMMFLFIGIILIGARMIGTEIGMWFELPSNKWINLIHSHIRGTDPDTHFLRAKRLDLETLRSKKKLFKDVGGSFRIAGHSCRRTYETIGFTMPDWLSDYFHRIKITYGLKNSDEFKELKDKLKKLENPVLNTLAPSLEDQLKNIDLLKPIMNDEKRKNVLLNMPFEQLKNLEMVFYDGISHNGDDVELFIDSATPNELDVLEGQTYINEMERSRNYRDRGQSDWTKYIPWMIMFMFACVIIILIAKGIQ